MGGRSFWVEVEALQGPGGLEYRLLGWEAGGKVNREALLSLVEALFTRAGRGKGWLYRGRRWAGRRETFSVNLGPWRLRGDAEYDEEGWLRRSRLQGPGVEIVIEGLGTGEG